MRDSRYRSPRRGEALFSLHDLSTPKKILPLIIAFFAIYGFITHYQDKDTVSALSSQPQFRYEFNDGESLAESSSPDQSASPDWWLKYGGELRFKSDRGRTIQGKLPKNNPLRIAYAERNPIITDNGFYPQNNFLLLTRKRWQNIGQEYQITIKEENLENPINSQPGNAVGMVSRYIDDHHHYMAGFTMDGRAVIRKVLSGREYVLATIPYFNGTYDRSRNPSLLPSNKTFGMKMETLNVNDTIVIRLYIDAEANGSWKLVAEGIDDNRSYGGSGFTGEGKAGITTSFVDAEFDNYKLFTPENPATAVGDIKAAASTTVTIAEAPPLAIDNKIIPLTSPVAPSSAGSGNPFAGARLYINPNSDAKKQADAWRSSRPQDAALMDKIAGQSEAFWLGGWNSNIYEDVKNTVTRVTNAGALPVFIAYNIPKRDCGSYSAGGANNPDGYRAWIRALANGIGNRKAVVILEPDALAGMGCLSQSDKDVRYELLSQAVITLKSLGNTAVYLDAGNPSWINADDMSGRLRRAGVDRADGFSLNVSNFYTTAENVNYGQNISRQIGNKHFIIDTSRNGLGSNGQWCNPPGRALGARPTTVTNHPLVDAFLWLKIPGQSDGSCNGAPRAGAWWPEYAIGLVERAAY